MPSTRNKVPWSVFLAEDNPEDEALTVRCLRQLSPSCRVRVARDGEEALGFLKETATPTPDLVLLDLKLPKLNGIEVLGLMRGIRTLMGLPVVILSSSDEPSDVTACYEAGANAFVCKPVNFDDYQEAVSVLGRFWLEFNRRPA